MPWIFACWMATLGPVASGAETVATSSLAPRILGFDRFFGAPPAEQAATRLSSREAGELLLQELNCAACHDPAENTSSPIRAKQAPRLENVGARLQPEYIQRFLRQPSHVKPGTTMPSLFASQEADLADSQVEALTHYLAGRRSSESDEISETARGSHVQQGKQLYHTVGCVACHNAFEPEATTFHMAMPLGELARKYTLSGLAGFLADPLQVRPSGRMPAFPLPEDGHEKIAHYLWAATGGEVHANVRVQVYEGHWNRLPDFDELSPTSEGEVTGFDLGMRPRDDFFALRFEGWLPISRPGNYRFHLASDDGSRLSIDGEVVVDNDGVHGRHERSGSKRLTKGSHKVVLEYFEEGGEEILSVEFAGPRLRRRDLGGVLRLKPAEEDASQENVSSNSPGMPWKRNPELAEQGRRLFHTIGCSACHGAEQDADIPDLGTDKQTAPPLESVDISRGCLSPEPAAPAAVYHLSYRQREVLALAIRAQQDNEPLEESPGSRIHRTFLTFNCYACHERDGMGGVTSARSPYFETTEKEMGDEARIPPLLTGVGAKLQAEWLAKILQEGSKDRPYMRTVMPRFGEENVGHLTKLLTEVDALESFDEPEFTESPGRTEAQGRFLCGGQALGCINCHTYGEQRALGVQAIDLLLMPQRLRRGWFHRYMVDPPKFRPGTRMPTGWPGGQAVMRDIYDGSTPHQIDAIWRYLARGERTQPPLGSVAMPMELVAKQEPVLYRNFIRGAGVRAIGVGYPEKANLAFDAEGMSLRMIWQGPFISAQRHWTGRGQGSEPPLGDNIVHLAESPPFARLESPGADWPSTSAKELGYRFRGYRLDEQRRPTFLYTWNDLRIEESPIPSVIDDYPALKRVIPLQTDQPLANTWFLAVRAENSIEKDGDAYLIDERWRTRLESTKPPIVLGNELRVPVDFENGSATIVQEFLW